MSDFGLLQVFRHLEFCNMIHFSLSHPAILIMKFVFHHRKSNNLCVHSFLCMYKNCELGDYSTCMEFFLLIKNFVLSSLFCNALCKGMSTFARARTIQSELCSTSLASYEWLRCFHEFWQWLCLGDRLTSAGILHWSTYAVRPYEPLEHVAAPHTQTPFLDRARYLMTSFGNTTTCDAA